jgi:tRNA-2-methylthio-N6-dimethylallyladenosine synthase
LLVLVHNIPGLVRLRFLTSYPKDMSDKLIDTIACSTRWRAHSSPVQSGSNQVLENMRRGYTREEYLELIGRIRRAAPASPFQPISSLVSRRNRGTVPGDVSTDGRGWFSTVYQVAYSPRPGTLAYRWDDDVSRT